MTMKRSRDSTESLTNLATCLMMLAQDPVPDAARVFECKTCNRCFPSFQALGGHRASHKKPKLQQMMMEGEHENIDIQELSSQGKPKAHECSICGLEFSTGQALGGHMRRHRPLTKPSAAPPPPQLVPVFMRSNSKRILCLDLNLTPLENDLEFPVGKTFFEDIRSPVIHSFI